MAGRSSFDSVSENGAAQTMDDPTGAAVTRACLYIEEHLDERVTLKRLGQAVGFTPTHLQRVFKQRTGVSPKEYANALRLGKLKAHLREGGSVTRAIYESGYGSSSTAYAAGEDHLGMTPATYRAGGRGARISFTIVDCAIGRLLVARTERGICGIAVGDSDAMLEEWLRTEYPLAEVEASPADVREVCERVAAIAAGEDDGEELPLDVRATAFQWRVWRALRRIPSGETRSYSEVAEMIGAPRARRAVARACATNPVALVIPCHRVVRADGSLGGYGWGPERKQVLLDSERKHARAAERRIVKGR